MLTTIRFDQGFREWNLTKKCIPIVVVSSAGSCIKKSGVRTGIGFIELSQVPPPRDRQFFISIIKLWAITIFI